MLVIIAAVAQNNCIGQENKLPWHIPEDLKNFKRLTTNKIVLMGRKTWESIPEKFRPLPQRTNIVISRQKNLIVPNGVQLFSSIDEAISAHQNEEVFVIGGAEIYNQAMPLASRLFITEVNKIVAGDTFFPAIDSSRWREVNREAQAGFSFVTYDRIKI